MDVGQGQAVHEAAFMRVTALFDHELECSEIAILRLIAKPSVELF